MARKMKDSGVEWIGQIPEDWKIVKFKTQADIIMGQSPDGNDIRSEGQTLFMQGNREFGEKYPNPTLYCDTCNKHSRIGDILMSVRAPVGAINESDKIYGIGRGLCSIKAENIDNGFLKYYLKKSVEDLRYYSNGSTFEAITVEKLENFRITIPTESEQVRIAKFLDEKIGEIDAIIDKTKMSIEEYKKYKVSVITEAILGAGREEDRYKNVDSIFIKRIPIEWELCKLKYLSEEIGDGLHSTPEYDDEGDVYFINGNNIGREYLEIKSSTNKLNDLEYRKYKKPLLNKQTIMIALNGATYGKLSFYNFEKVLLGKSAGYITLKDCVNKRYMKYYLQSSLAKNFMSLSLNGTTIQNLSLGTLNEMLVIVPTEVKQQEIVEYLNEKCAEIDNLIAKKEAFIEEMEAYKKSLIYEYVTGKKEVL